MRNQCRHVSQANPRSDQAPILMVDIEMPLQRLRRCASRAQAKRTCPRCEINWSVHTPDIPNSALGTTASAQPLQQLHWPMVLCQCIRWSEFPPILRSLLTTLPDMPANRLVWAASQSSRLRGSRSRKKTNSCDRLSTTAHYIQGECLRCLTMEIHSSTERSSCSAG